LRRPKDEGRGPEAMWFSMAMKEEYPADEDQYGYHSG
jgi:hypothetical protein